MTAQHRVILQYDSVGILHVDCAFCGRSIAVDRDGKLTVNQRGDQAAQHYGSIGEIDMSIGVTLCPTPNGS